MATTIHDLARLTGLNPSTISRALRDDARIKPATREKIRELARRHGYVMNRSARSLATGRTRTLALLLGDLQNDNELCPARFADAVCVERGYNLAVLMHGGRRFNEQLQLLGQRWYDGAILVPPLEEQRKPETLELLRTLPVPAVFSDRSWEGAGLPVVTTAEEGAIAALLAAVREAGAGMIYVGFPTGNTVARSRRFFAEKLLAAGGIPWASNPEALAGLLKRHPHLPLAAFADSPWDLASLPAVLTESPPRRVIGAMFDSWKYSTPVGFDRIFLCIQDFESMGRRCAELLIDRLENGAPWPPDLCIEIPHREVVEVLQASRGELFRPTGAAAAPYSG